MKHAFLSLLVLMTLTGCFAPVDAPPPPTSIFSATPPQALPQPTNVPATVAPVVPSVLNLDDVPAFLATSAEDPNAKICADKKALQLIIDLKKAIQNRDGTLLASLVSPASGVGVRFIRDGKVVTYFDNIKFIFETTYQADWGLGAGSGAPVKGSFQEIVLPSLDLVFGANPLVTCNELKTGGATYIPEWPYSGMDYFSLYYPGTDEFGGLNWETWAIGILRQDGKLMLAALVHYAWEP